MSRELLIYADYDVALRYQLKMQKSCRINLSIAAVILALSLLPNMVGFLFYVIATIFLLLAGLAFYSRNSMLKDAEAGLLMFRFTPEGWYRNEKPVLYRWEDFKRVEFQDRAITFQQSKQHKILSSTISPMLMTEANYDKVEQWIREHLPDHMKS